MAQKTVEINEVVLGKLAEQMGISNADTALQARIDQEAEQIKGRLLMDAFLRLSEANQIAALTAVNANPLA